MNFDDQIIEFGKARNATSLPQLAFAVAHAAKAREITEDQADDIFEQYYTEGGRIQTDVHSASFRSKCSKLRQIIIAADPVLLTEVTDAYRDAVEGERVSLYDAIVAACRYLVTEGRRPGVRTIRELIRRSSP